MSRILRSLTIVLVLALIAVGWFWWNRPQRVDMASYVPADSLVYLEANSFTEVAAAVTGTDAWRQLEPYIDGKAVKYPSGVLTSLVSATGLASTPAVIAARAQVAFVVVDLNATSTGDTLEYKPQAALVVETHTSAARVKPAVEKMIAELANRAYGSPRFERVSVAGSEFLKWHAPDGQRQIIAAFDDSVVLVGNDERAVLACLAARRGERPSLLHQPDLEEMRTRLRANQALAFGYISSASAARLVADGAPMLFGKLPESSQFQKLIAVGAGRVLGSVGWSARSFGGGIEDHYFLALKPHVITRLRSPFAGGDQGLRQTLDLLPADTYSVTSYNLLDPSAAWASLSAAISAQVDALSAVIFTTGFRSLLAPYGIDEPDSFIKAIKPEVLTVRLEARSERALVIAGVADADVLHQFVARRFGPTSRTERVGDVELALSADGGYAASFVGGYFLLGSPEDIRHCLAARAAHATFASLPAKASALTRYLDRDTAANIVSYTKDNAPWTGLAATLAGSREPARTTPEGDQIARVIGDLPYTTAETTLGENGFERRTRSAFGQFGLLLSLLPPAAATKPGEQNP